jgi:hypothetical protein
MEKRIRLSSEKALIKKTELDQKYVFLFNFENWKKHLENYKMNEQRLGLYEHL